ncbi:Possible dihydroflavonol-4-reductase [Prochlorococcus marinus str. MIT 9515]|uniref:Possible dihydroflavonol-4-reductase n=1 Tax=Prochlorococcus marinus (strain MIT 9515) TaxID=167542 RepID=A2BY97_PROM5|nr:Possible dihydroflavonol-4-reductase [Prochlorococcus marinus str. MIT 9515]
MHCIHELLKEGYIVKGSLRNMKRAEEVRKSLKIDSENHKLEFCKLDLLHDEGWDEAAFDCDYLLHVASPFTIAEPKRESLLINPALEGTIRALNASKKSSKVKKVVLTSSMAAIAYGHDKQLCTPQDWTDTTKNVGAYVKSKTIAEKAAWDFVHNDNDHSFSMTTINPGMVFGPLLSDDIDGASAELLSKMINGKFPALPDAYFTVVDVRDVAKLHVDSLRNNKSDNKRIIATSPQGINIMKISKILRKNGYTKTPQKFIPTKMINSLASFNKEMKSMANMVNRGSYGADISETISIFNWEPISLEKTLIDMGNSLKQISTK